MIKFIFLLFCFFISAFFTFCKAQFEFTKKLESAYSELISLKLNNAQRIISEEKKLDPNNGITIYLEDYYDMFTLMILEDKNQYELLKSNQDKRLKTLSALKNDSPYYLFTQSEIYIHWAFVKYKYGHWLSSAWDLRKAYILLDENEKKYPDFLPNKKSLGMLRIFISFIPEEYQWLIDLLGFKGTKEKGFAEIALVVNSQSLYRTEALIVYSALLFHLEENHEKSISYIKRSYIQNKHNLLLCFVAVFILANHNRAEEALEILSQLPDNPEYIKFDYLNYLKAGCLMKKGNYNFAIDHFKLYLSGFKGLNYLKDSQYKIALCYWLMGDTKKAFEEKNKINTTGNSISWRDEMAENFSKEKKFPDVKLLKAKLLYDGGYFDESITLLENEQKNVIENTFKNRELSEFYYLLARNYQKKEVYENSLKYYQKVTTLTQSEPDEKNYYPAASCYQSGIIFKKQGNKVKAIEYFKKVLSYKDYIYEEHYKHKAKEKLNEMEEDK